MKKKISAFTLCFIAFFTIFAPSVFAFEQIPSDSVPIYDRAGLTAIADDPSGRYFLMADIDMGESPWDPIPFSGVFDGNGHTLYNLTITDPDPQPAPSVDGNHKEYDTLYAALFSRAQNAAIRNLHLLNADVQVRTGQNCFASGLVGYAEGVEITGCSVSGRVYLESGNIMCGVAGMVGFGYGSVTDSAVDVTLTLVDTNQEIKCEEFLGGVMATGYVDIDNCRVSTRGYASVYGYVHNGGVAGMYYVHTDDAGHQGYVTNCTVEAVIDFFEANEDRRAYCDPVVGEQLDWNMTIADNTVTHFENNETGDYSIILLPERCEAPSYTSITTEGSCESFGFTTYTCEGCQYSYTDEYTAPLHQPGEWEIVPPAAPNENGWRARACTLCLQPIDQEPYISVTGCVLNETSLTLAPESSVQLTAALEPENTTGKDVEFVSSDTGVATVDEQGTVTAVSPGAAVITCLSLDGANLASCEVRVKKPFPLWPLLLMIAAVLLVACAVAISAKKRRAKRRKKRRPSSSSAAGHTYKNTYRR